MDIKWCNDLKNIEKKYKFKKSIKKQIIELRNNQIEIESSYENLVKKSDIHKQLDKIIISLNKSKDLINQITYKDSIDIFDPVIKWNIAYSINSIKKTITLIETFQKFIPRTGRNNKSTYHFVISSLVDLFCKNTTLIPNNKHDRAEDTYSGELYEFILDIKPLIEAIGVKVFISEQSLGRYINIALTQKSVNKLFARDRT